MKVINELTFFFYSAKSLPKALLSALYNQRKNQLGPSSRSKLRCHLQSNYFSLISLDETRELQVLEKYCHKNINK